MAVAVALADAIEAALPGWVERSVETMMVAYRGSSDDAVAAAARVAGAAAVADIAPRVRILLSLDLDRQGANPLSLLRQAVAYPTEVLRRAGVPPVVRDEFAERHFPDDDYDLTPASFADIDPALAEPGLAWGVAKAWARR
ncbi:MAG: hypothetical protein ACRDZW_00040 [Acidimicrobiales bacterium]